MFTMYYIVHNNELVKTIYEHNLFVNKRVPTAYDNFTRSTWNKWDVFWKYYHRRSIIIYHKILIYFCLFLNICLFFYDTAFLCILVLMRRPKFYFKNFVLVCTLFE